jgi:heme/copper-type cytochrome/quinol oxidase subunit 2
VHQLFARISGPLPFLFLPFAHPAGHRDRGLLRRVVLVVVVVVVVLLLLLLLMMVLVLQRQRRRRIPNICERETSGGYWFPFVNY